jgi:hypothetical protein
MDAVILSHAHRQRQQTTVTSVARFHVSWCFGHWREVRASVRPLRKKEDMRRRIKQIVLPLLHVLSRHYHTDGDPTCIMIKK